MQKKILFFTLPLAALVIIASLAGLLSPGFYLAETKNWQAQSIGQDAVDLLVIVPSLLISAALAFRNNRSAAMVLSGVLLYLTYTFTIYCFNIHFNRLFVVYCLCLGLSFYALIYLLYKLVSESRVKEFENKAIFRVVGIYFIILSAVFYFLWLSEIIPAILKNGTPKNIEAGGLFTNPVHVLDLSLMLPAIFVTGIFLLKRKPIGFILAPVLLTSFVLLDITIGVLTVVMKAKGMEGDLMLTAIMAVLAIVSLVMLNRFLKNIPAL